MGEPIPAKPDEFQHNHPFTGPAVDRILRDPVFEVLHYLHSTLPYLSLLDASSPLYKQRPAARQSARRSHFCRNHIIKPENASLAVCTLLPNTHLHFFLPATDYRNLGFCCRFTEPFLPLIKMTSVSLPVRSSLDSLIQTRKPKPEPNTPPQFPRLYKAKS